MHLPDSSNTSVESLLYHCIVVIFIWFLESLRGRLVDESAILDRTRRADGNSTAPFLREFSVGSRGKALV